MCLFLSRYVSCYGRAMGTDMGIRAAVYVNFLGAACVRSLYGFMLRKYIYIYNVDAVVV